MAVTGRLRSGLPIDPTVSSIIAPTGFRSDIVAQIVSGRAIFGNAQTVRNGVFASQVTLAPTSTVLVRFADGSTGFVTVANTTGDLNQDLGNNSNASGSSTGGDRPYAAPGVSFKRNSFRNRPFYNIDLRVQKEILIGEKYKIIPSLEFFNVFGFDNIEFQGTTVTNYGNPGINERTGAVLAPSNPLFLKLRDANGNLLPSNKIGPPFAAQVGIRFIF